MVLLVALSSMGNNSIQPLPPLPTDIQTEILLRLPVKSLKRFQCACKLWYFLISSPKFQHQHFIQAQHNHLLLTLQTDDNILDKRDSEDLTLRFLTYTEQGALVNKFSQPVEKEYFNGTVTGMPFMQSCLGLVCVSSTHYYSPSILICNPSTQEFVSLPPIRKSNDCVGFGYAASSGEFKVVRFFHVEFQFEVKGCCEVCTLGTNQWREARSPPYWVSEGTAPFLHGALHILPQILDNGVKESHHIAAFDIDSQEYREGIPLPRFYHSLGDCEHRDICVKRNFVKLTKLGGSLCLSFDFMEMAGRMELWLLMDYKNVDWVKGYNIDITSVVSEPRYSVWGYAVENMDKESIILNVFEEEGVKVFCYNRQDQNFTMKIDKEWAGAYYEESLYPVGNRVTSGNRWHSEDKQVTVNQHLRGITSAAVRS